MRGIAHRPGCSQPPPEQDENGGMDIQMLRGNGVLWRCPECLRGMWIDGGEPS